MSSLGQLYPQSCIEPLDEEMGMWWAWGDLAFRTRQGRPLKRVRPCEGCACRQVYTG